ncbi:MAG: hypothetical protein AB8B80_14685 [Marinicellaceae bacterium]
MSEDTLPAKDYSNYPEHISKFEEGLVQFLDQYNLPTTGIFVGVTERVKVFQNFDGVIGLLDNELVTKSVYLSKFVAASASGLFDAALNYLWDETILQLRRRIAMFDLEYFFDNAIGEDKRNDFRTEDDLVKMQDSQLIIGARKIELISEIGLQHLTYINHLRNWASAAHPNQNDISGLQLISWLETCMKEVISVPIPNNAIGIKKLLSNIRRNPITAENADEMAIFLAELNRDQCDSLGLAFFGLYTSQDTDQMLRQNIKLLLPKIWNGIDESAKESFGLKYAHFSAHHETNQKNLASQFLEIVGGHKYLPDDLRVVEIKQACDDLRNAHRRLNNFYNEPTFVRVLGRMAGDPPKIPQNVNKDYVFTIVECFLTNGHGVAIDAQPAYIKLIEGFTSQQATMALLSFKDNQISSMLQFDKCQFKYRELLGYLRPIITNPSTLELLEQVNDFGGGFKNLKGDSRIKRAIQNLEQLIK